ncbi:hypothetical protein [Gallaecimonas sp. GXIMD4217]|uniref:hypothetical protein n=1 Tax=Gallaecimonas sp. GXIMD4217 TaxID=3131927 RepID=UPI00311ADC8B
MRLAAIISVVILVLWGLMALAQLWYQPLDGEVFFKLTLSAALIEVVVVAVALIRREYLTEKRQRKDRYID